MGERVSFAGSYRFLSNFYPASVFYEGQFYPSVEHAYQAAKTTSVVLRAEISMMTAGEAKRVGRGLQLVDNWDIRKLNVMRELVFQKFLNHPHLCAKLIDTHPLTLVEVNCWGDTFWGCVEDGTGKLVGENHLGRILMGVREKVMGHARTAS